MNLRTIIIQILLICSVNTEAFIIDHDYKNGRTVCQNNPRPFAKFISVYENPLLKRGLTEIYYYTNKKFNPKLPSILFFTGGPGVNPRSTHFELENSNVIFFDQRGTACSRPETKNQFLDSHFYQSLFTAYDALAIIDDLNISKLTVYGQSYGTIPATIFGSVFKERTNNVILEGVIFKGDESLWHSKRKQINLMKVYKGLTQIEQEKILEMNSYLPKNWFSKIGNMMLYLDNGLNIYSNFLTSLFNMEKESQKSFVQNFYAEEKLEESFDFGDVMMGMIACQEISMNNPNLSMTLIFDEKMELIYDHDNVDLKERCDRLSFLEENTFDALKYSLNVPTLYLLGENDGATDLDQGLNHAKYVAKENALVLIKKAGGHLPNLGFLKDDRFCNDLEEDCSGLREHRLQKKLFETFIHQSQVDDQILLRLNEVAELPWKKI